MFGGLGADTAADSATNTAMSDVSAGLKRRSKPIVVEAFELIAAERARDVPGVDLDAVTELDEASQRVEQPLRTLARLDREIRPRRIPDEERVAGEHEPRFWRAGRVQHSDAAVLRAVARGMDAAQYDLTERDLVPVLERIVRVLGAGSVMDADRDSVLEGETPVAREMIGVRVGLDRPHESNFAALRLLQVLLDRVGRIDDDGLTGALVADEVGGTAERIVDELREDHDAADRSTGCRYFS
jgi:hypothetical protein